MSYQCELIQGIPLKHLFSIAHTKGERYRYHPKTGEKSLKSVDISIVKIFGEEIEFDEEIERAEAYYEHSMFSFLKDLIDKIDSETILVYEDPWDHDLELCLYSDSCDPGSYIDVTYIDDKEDELKENIIKIMRDKEYPEKKIEFLLNKTSANSKRVVFYHDDRIPYLSPGQIDYRWEKADDALEDICGDKIVA